MGACSDGLLIGHRRVQTDAYTATARRREPLAESPLTFGLGASVAAALPGSPGSVDLEPALDLILQPLLVETLTAIGEGKAPEDALPPDADPELRDAALRRLLAIKAIEPPTDQLLRHHTMTDRGRQLLRLLDDLDAALARTQHPDY
jgi:hypothetical protein